MPAAPPHGRVAYRLVIVPAGASFTPGTVDPLDDTLVYFTSKARADHPWIAEPPEGDGQRLDVLTGRIEDGEYRVRIIDVPATLSTLVCNTASLVPEGNAGLDGDAITSGDWTVERDYGTSAGPHNWWGHTVNHPFAGGSALFTWSVPYDGGPWVRATWITRTFDGTEAGGPAFQPFQHVAFRFLVNWTLDTGPGNVFVEVNGNRASGLTASFDFWTLDPDATDNIVNQVLHCQADANGEVVVKLGLEGYAPSCNVYVEFRDLEIVACEVQEVASVATDRYFTGWLADDDARQRLLGRPAYIEESPDGGATWPTVLYAGYVQQLTLQASLTWDITVGDTRRVERLTRAWTGFGPTTSATLQHFTNVHGVGSLGGVYRGFEPFLEDRGLRTYTVAASYTDGNGIEPPAVKLVKVAGPAADVINVNRARTANYYEDRAWPYSNRDIRGSFPRLAWYLFDPTTEALVKGPLLPLGNKAEPAIQVFGGRIADNQLGDILPSTEHYVQWDTDSAPADGTQYKAIQVAREPSEEFPLYVNAHPVDLLTALFTVHGIPYDSASATTCKANLGAELRHIEEVTDGDETLQDLIDRLSLAYGFTVRRGTDGINEFVQWRQKLTGLPGTTIDETLLTAEGGPTFELAAPTRVNRLSVTAHVITPWEGYRTQTVKEPRMLLGFIPAGVKKRKIITNRNDKPASGLIARAVTITTDYSTDGSTPDSSTFGAHEMPIDLGGMPAWVGGQPMNLVQFADGIARLVFDGHARGRQAASWPVRRTASLGSALLGDAVTVDVPHLPNAQLGQSPTSQRGGRRPFRVVQQTATPTGALLALVDEGTGVAFGTAPSISVTVVRASTSNVTLQVLVSPGLTFAAAGAQIEFEVKLVADGDTIDTSTPGTCYTVMDASLWDADSYPVRLGDFPVGYTPFIRARAWLYGGAASAWSYWCSTGGCLTGGAPGNTLANLIITAVTADGATLIWTNLENPASGQVKVQYRETAVGGAYTTFATLAAGSFTDDLTGLTADTGYDVRVVLIDGSNTEYGTVLTGQFVTRPPFLSGLNATNITTHGATLTWTNPNDTETVRVSYRQTGAPTWFAVADLLPGSIQYVLTGLLEDTDYDVKVALIGANGADLGNGNGDPTSAPTDSFTTLSSLPTLAAPLTPVAFAGVDPFTNQSDPGLFGMRVFANPANPVPHDIVFEVARETAVGSGTAGAYVPVATVPAQVGGPTWLIQRAANDGRLRYMRALSRASGYNDSAYSAIVSILPWPTTPVPPLGGQYSDSVVITATALAEDAHGNGSQAFPDGATIYRVLSPDNTNFRLRLYATSAARTSDESRPSNNVNWPADLLLDVDVTTDTSFDVNPLPRPVQILLAALGDLTTYWTLTNYDAATQDIRAQVFYTVAGSPGGPQQ